MEDLKYKISKLQVSIRLLQRDVHDLKRQLKDVRPRRKACKVNGVINRAELLADLQRNGFTRANLSGFIVRGEIGYLFERRFLHFQRLGADNQWQTVRSHLSADLRRQLEQYQAENKVSPVTYWGGLAQAPAEDDDGDIYKLGNGHVF